MTKIKKNEEKEEISGSSDILGNILNDSKGEHFNDINAENIPISTGSLILDSLVKIKTGSVIRLCANQAEAGKSSEAFVLATNFMSTIPKGKTLYIKAEGRLSPEMQARSGLKFVTDPKDWVYGTVFIWSINIFETIADGITKLLKKMYEDGEKLCIIWDSLDGSILRADSQKSLWQDGSIKVAGVPLLIKLFFKTMSLSISHYDALMIIISQYTAPIQIDPYAKNIPRQASASGGSAIGHQSDYVFEYGVRYQGDYILEKPDEKPDVNKNKAIGVYATIEIKKSSTDVTGTKVKIPIKKGRIGNQIWTEKELTDMILSFSLATRKAAWITFDQAIIDQAKQEGIELKSQIQGMNQLYDYLENDKQAFNFFLTKIKAAIS